MPDRASSEPSNPLDCGLPMGPGAGNFLNSVKTMKAGAQAGQFRRTVCYELAWQEWPCDRSFS
jgi:hypothetical protein